MHCSSVNPQMTLVRCESAKGESETTRTNDQRNWLQWLKAALKLGHLEMSRLWFSNFQITVIIINTFSGTNSFMCSWIIIGLTYGHLHHLFMLKTKHNVSNGQNTLKMRGICVNCSCGFFLFIALVRNGEIMWLFHTESSCLLWN